jgi:hypothetical protein
MITPGRARPGTRAYRVVAGELQLIATLPQPWAAREGGHRSGQCLLLSTAVLAAAVEDALQRLGMLGEHMTVKCWTNSPMCSPTTGSVTSMTGRSDLRAFTSLIRERHSANSRGELPVDLEPWGLVISQD